MKLIKTYIRDIAFDFHLIHSLMIIKKTGPGTTSGKKKVSGAAGSIRWMQPWLIFSLLMTQDDKQLPILLLPAPAPINSCWSYC